MSVTETRVTEEQVNSHAVFDLLNRLQKNNKLTKVLRNINKAGLIKVVHLIARKSFKFVEKHFSLHITPAHFYSPLPITNELDPKVFEKVYDCVGVDWNLDKQLEFLKKTFPKYSEEFMPSTNGGLSLVDAFALYTMIREKKPEVMIEIGAGESTKISLQALRMNKSEGNSFRFYAVEPYPTDECRAIQDKEFELIDKKLQDVDVDLLISADLLFIDSSHVSKTDSDVNCEILEIVPKLKVGTLVHWHDIVMPTNYWKDWNEHGNKFWNESYMVHSFMLFNDSFKILWAARYMQLNHYNKMEKIFPYIESQHRLMSFWIERTK